MANFRSTDALRNAMLQAIADKINASSGQGTIKIYTGTQPADADDAPAGVLLATLKFSDPCQLSIASGVLTFDAITEDSSADNTGIATWARIQDSSGAKVFDCDVGVTGSGKTIELNTTSIVTGGAVRCSAAVCTAPAG